MCSLCGIDPDKTQPPAPCQAHRIASDALREAYRLVDVLCLEGGVDSA